MFITCCYNCEDKQAKCHSHCETYHTQKILKILVEAQEQKEKNISHSIANQKLRQIDKAMHINYRARRK